MSHQKFLYSLLFLAVFVSSCIDNGFGVDFPEGETEGYRPIYSQTATPDSIFLKYDVELKNPGKIYTYGDMLLVNEPFLGIHVYDNRDISNPEKLYFINIKGNVDMAVKDNILYADNMADLLLLRIDYNGLVDIKRKEDVFQVNDFLLPPAVGFFECVDETKGEVVGWELTTLNSPECFY